jgi:hypothetical protein
MKVAIHRILKKWGLARRKNRDRHVASRKTLLRPSQSLFFSSQTCLYPFFLCERLQMKKGFVLVAVMLILFLMGTEFLILNSTSNFIAIETNNALLQADKQNLISSGLALAAVNNFQKGDTIEPDATGLAWKEAKMSIKIEDAGLAEISVFCKRGTRELTSIKKYHISQ